MARRKRGESRPKLSGFPFRPKRSATCVLSPASLPAQPSTAQKNAQAAQGEVPTEREERWIRAPHQSRRRSSTHPTHQASAKSQKRAACVLPFINMPGGEEEEAKNYLRSTTQTHQTRNFSSCQNLDFLHHKSFKKKYTQLRESNAKGTPEFKNPTLKAWGRRRKRNVHQQSFSKAGLELMVRPVTRQHS